MRYIKLIIIAAFLSTMFTGCSYVSDSIEGAITERSSFSATATYDPTGITVSWDKSDTDAEFAGVEIYRTSRANDEYAKYILVASRYEGSVISGDLTLGSMTTCKVNLPGTSGVYFYRVGIIYMGKDDNDVIYPMSSSNYYSYTNIDSISGYAKVVIP